MLESKSSSSSKPQRKNSDSFPTSTDYQTQYDNTLRYFRFHHIYILIA